MTEKIEREISIQAPIATVWDVITKPEYISQWFGSQVEIDVRPGGKGRLIWGEDFEAPLEIVEVEKPHLFSFLWVAPDRGWCGDKAFLHRKRFRETRDYSRTEGHSDCKPYPWLG